MRLSWDWMLYHSAHRQRPARWAQENLITQPQSSSGVALHAAQAAHAPSSPFYRDYASQSFPSTCTIVGQQARTQAAQRRLLTCCTLRRQHKRPAARMPLQLTTWPQVSSICTQK